jgi:YHS domain-containing protein
VKALLRSAVVAAALFTSSIGAAIATEGEFGGECVMGLALGKDIKTDCSVNTVYDGKTYCFGNETAKQLFLKKPDEFLLKAQVYYSSKPQQSVLRHGRACPAHPRSLHGTKPKRGCPALRPGMTMLKK